MNLIMNPTVGQNTTSQPLTNGFQTNGAMSARSKVMQNWNSSFSKIDKSPDLPATEQTTPRTSKNKCRRLNGLARRDSGANSNDSTNSGTISGEDLTDRKLEVVKEEPALPQEPEAKNPIDAIERKDLIAKSESSCEDGQPMECDKADETDANIPKKRAKKEKTVKEVPRHSKTIREKKIKEKKLSSVRPPIALNNSNPYMNIFQKFISDTHAKLNESTNPQKPNSLLNYTPKPLSNTQKKAKQITKRASLQNNMIKTKKPRNRPTVVKQLMDSSSFSNFCKTKFPIEEGVAFIQDRSCVELTKEYASSALNSCRDCAVDKNSITQTCRFFQYRTLIRRGDKISVYGFAEQTKATHDDVKIWLPFDNPKNLDVQSAQYLMVFVGQQFCQIFNSEERMAQNLSPVAVTWKKPVKGIRELCDVCETTIFNTHLVCEECGLAVCTDCYNSRSQQTNGPINGSSYRKNTRNYDEFGWLLCTNKSAHNINKFLLARFITSAVFGSVNWAYHQTRNARQIRGECCDRLRTGLRMNMRSFCDQSDLYAYCNDSVPRQFLCDGRLLLLEDPKCSDNLKLFQLYWLKGYAVMIQNVNSSLKSELWSPNSFNQYFGRQFSRLVNCMTGQILPNQAMCNFWDGFEDVSKRLVNPDTGEEMILKLKDWPPNAEFRDKLPLWFDDLMDALPLKEYTRYDGIRNLAFRLPDFFVRPDLGPKMYCAYGSVLHPDKGTTNLHLDMSDAVNVMIYVGVAHKDGVPLESHIAEAKNTLLKGGCDEAMMKRAIDAGQKVGALWHIWKAEDANKIRQFIYEIAIERNIRVQSNTDPIHDQSWYLDEDLRTRLQQRYGVKDVAIAQCLGDAILVPAGAPHQVQNIHSCIKVAGEFVSPENVAHCLTMTQQFRNLSKRHNNHQDKLQIKNIIYHTIKDSLYVLSPEVRYQRPPSPVLKPRQMVPTPTLTPTPTPTPTPIPTPTTSATTLPMPSNTPMVSTHSSSSYTITTSDTTASDGSLPNTENTSTISPAVETTAAIDDTREEASTSTSTSTAISQPESHTIVDSTLNTENKDIESNPDISDEPISQTSHTIADKSDVALHSPEKPAMKDKTEADDPLPSLTSPYQIRSAPNSTDDSLLEALPPPPILRPYGFSDDDSEAKCGPSES